MPGFGYQCGVLIAGTVAYIEAVFAKHASYSVAMASTSGTVCLLAAIVTAFSYENAQPSSEHPNPTISKYGTRQRIASCS